MTIPKQRYEKKFGGTTYTLAKSFVTKSQANAYAKKVRKTIKHNYSMLARVVKTEHFWLVYVTSGKRVRGVNI